MTTDLGATVQGQSGKGGTAVEPIPQEQAALSQLGQQLDRELPLGLTGVADGDGQRIMQTYLQEHRRRDFGEGGFTAATGGFDQLAQQLRSVGDTELSAIQGHQAPSPIEGFGMVTAMGATAQGITQPALPHRP